LWKLKLSEIRKFGTVRNRSLGTISARARELARPSLGGGFGVEEWQHAVCHQTENQNPTRILDRCVYPPKYFHASLQISDGNLNVGKDNKLITQSTVYRVFRPASHLLAECVSRAE